MSETKKHIAYKPIIDFDDYSGSNPLLTAYLIMDEDGIEVVRCGMEERLKEWFEKYDEVGLLPVPTEEEASEILSDFEPDNDDVLDDETLNRIFDEEGPEGTELRLDLLVNAAIAAGFEIVERDFTKDAIERDERDAQARNAQ